MKASWLRRLFARRRGRKRPLRPGMLGLPTSILGAILVVVLSMIGFVATLALRPDMILPVTVLIAALNAVALALAPVAEIAAAEAGRRLRGYFEARAVYAGRLEPRRLASRVNLSINSFVTAVLASSFVLALQAYGLLDRTLVAALTVSMLAVPPGIYAATMAEPGLRASGRKLSAEIELPFALAMIYVLAQTHLSFVGILERIRRSVSFKAWAREMALAERIARFRGST